MTQTPLDNAFELAPSRRISAFTLISHTLAITFACIIIFVVFDPNSVLLELGTSSRRLSWMYTHMLVRSTHTQPRVSWRAKCTTELRLLSLTKSSKARRLVAWWPVRRAHLSRGKTLAVERRFTANLPTQTRSRPCVELRRPLPLPRWSIVRSSRATSKEASSSQTFWSRSKSVRINLREAFVHSCRRESTIRRHTKEAAATTTS